MSGRVLTELIDVCCAYFDNLGFRIEELPRLDPSLEWRPKFLAIRERYPTPSKVALEVRENGQLDEDVLVGPLREVRKLFPDLPIFFAVPVLSQQDMEQLERKAVELGAGIYAIEDVQLRRIRDADVPFQEDRTAVFPIRPDTEYRNRRNVSKMLFRCSGTIDWLDKHFTSRGFTIIHDHLSERGFTGLTRMRVLTGSQQVDGRFRRDLTTLRNELQTHGISLLCRTLQDADQRRIHDRYVIAPNIAFNVLPIGSLIRGQTGDLVETPTPPDFEPYWNNGTDVT